MNAFYIPAETRIVFCYELRELLASIFVPDGAWTPEQQDRVDGAFRFILMHEVGHALVHVLDLPVTGREEDVVDQLAVFHLVRDGDEKGAQAAVAGVSAIQPASSEFRRARLRRRALARTGPILQRALLVLRLESTEIRSHRGERLAAGGPGRPVPERVGPHVQGVAEYPRAVPVVSAGGRAGRAARSGRARGSPLRRPDRRG